MTKYGKAFYGSDEIHEILNGEIGAYYSPNSSSWQFNVKTIFKGITVVYKLRADHWFYGRDEFRRAKKPDDEIDNPLADYSDDELQAEIDQRKAQDEGILKLARKVCADNYSITRERPLFIQGQRDDWNCIKIAKCAIIAGMELREA